jgi:transposase InsO family protein
MDDYLMIKKIFDQGKAKLGWRSIKMVLEKDYSLIWNHKRIKRIMRKYHLVTKIRRRNPYKMIMKKTQEHCTFDNLLNRNFKQIVPRKVLCTDITYLRYGQGRMAYLQAVKDITTREIVSWQLSNNLAMPFVLKSIDNLASIKIFTDDSMIHSDQGFHYTNPEFIAKIKKLNLIQSMSGKGNCIDNSPMESFFGHLKDDIDYKQARTFEALYDMIDTYMEYYNKERYQWGIQKMTPVQYRDHLLSKNT